MARKLRLEYEGAIYHVISRGNYRADVFATEKTKAAFVRCLGEAALKAGWVVHAWCVMSNHYHLCIETPEPNLVDGMRWLQCTFSVRFNRFRMEHGHVFQGRYKALLVDPEAAGAVCHYIHLNPVRAGLATTAALWNWPWTSVWMMFRPENRPPWYSPDVPLGHAGSLADTPQGWGCYSQFLCLLQENEPDRRRLGFERLSKDWAIGSKEFKCELIDEHQEWVANRSRGDAGPRAFAAELWKERLDSYLAALGKTVSDVEAEPKAAAWKIAIAAAMKLTTTASNPWLARQLKMGSPYRLCRLACRCLKSPESCRPFVDLCKVQSLTR